MFKAGDWIIDKINGSLGTVVCVYTDGVTAKFGRMSAIKENSKIELAPLDIRQDDLIVMQHMAVETKDKEWFKDLGNRMGEKAHG
jgi:hypothetical protein